MTYPSDYRFTKDHEWIVLRDGVAVVGISEFAQSELGELVFVDLPKIEKNLSTGDILCVVESTKAASDVYCPVAGVVVEVNSKLVDEPGLVNKDPHGTGWLVKLSGVTSDHLASLMTAEEYSKFVQH